MRCGEEDATFLHLAWLCVGVLQFWRVVVPRIDEVTKLVITLTPMACLLGMVA